MARVKVTVYEKETVIEITPETLEDRKELSKLWKTYCRTWNPSDSVVLFNVDVILNLYGDSYKIIIARPITTGHQS